jgi:hypothetical protein
LRGKGSRRKDDSVSMELIGKCETKLSFSRKSFLLVQDFRNLSRNLTKDFDVLVMKGFI